MGFFGQTQLINIWLLCLAALKTKDTGSELKIGWIKGDESLFLRQAISFAICYQIMDLVKLYVSGGKAAFLHGAMRKILRSIMTFVPDSAEWEQAVASLFIYPHSPNVPLTYSQYSVYLVFQCAFNSNSDDDDNMFVNSEFVLPPNFFDEVFDSLQITPKKQKVAEDFYVSKNTGIIAKGKEIKSRLVGEHVRKFAQLQNEYKYQPVP